MEEQADQASELVAPAPTEWGKGLRCCVPCHLVKTFEQFYEEGCQNCPFLGMEGDRERIYDATTTDFHGLTAIVDPQTSWVSKWLHHRKHVPGCYALSVDAQQLPQHIEDILADNGIKWQREQ